MVVSGDFTADGRTDLALTGTSGWAGIPVTLSNGCPDRPTVRPGTFRQVGVGDIPQFPRSARPPFTQLADILGAKDIRGFMARGAGSEIPGTRRNSVVARGAGLGPDRARRHPPHRRPAGGDPRILAPLPVAVLYGVGPRQGASLT